MSHHGDDLDDGVVSLSGSEPAAPTMAVAAPTTTTTTATPTEPTMPDMNPMVAWIKQHCKLPGFSDGLWRDEHDETTRNFLLSSNPHHRTLFLFMHKHQLMVVQNIHTLSSYQAADIRYVSMTVCHHLSS